MYLLAFFRITSSVQLIYNKIQSSYDLFMIPSNIIHSVCTVNFTSNAETSQ